MTNVMEFHSEIGDAIWTRSLYHFNIYKWSILLYTDKHMIKQWIDH